MTRTLLRRRAPRGLTLVELLIAVALTVMIVGIVAGISVQVQRSIGLSTAREDAARVARNVLDDIERDLSSLMPRARAPEPFSPPTGTPKRVLELEMDAPTTPVTYRRDRLRMLTNVRDPGGSGNIVRAFVDYGLDPVVEPPDGGPPVGRFHRKIVEYAGGTGVTTGTAQDDRVTATNVLEFRLEWLKDEDGADGPLPAAFADPDSTTKDGTAFSYEGDVTVAQDVRGTKLTVTTSGMTNMVDTAKIGSEVWLELGESGNRILTRALLRSKSTTAGVVYVADRLDPATGIPCSRFAGPPLIRCSMRFSFGTGPDAPTGRFTRIFAVPVH